VPYLSKNFKLGKITLPSNIFCAPLAGCSDLPFRKMFLEYGHPGLMYCEMVKMEPLVRRDEGTLRLLNYEEGMHPIGAQICGSKPELAGESARMIEDLGFDVIDLNCGCPVDKVTKDGSGSGMLKTPQRIGEVIANMVAAVKIPVTVKIRAGWDENSINAKEIVKIAEDAGAVAICIHGRTREQGYKGPANWEWIREAKEVAKNIIVIGNGDLFTPGSVEKMKDVTGCDAFLISRGTMGHPWIVDDIYRYFEGESATVRTPHHVRDALFQHMDYIISYQPERKAVFDMRRIGCWYLKNGHGMRKLREKISRSSDLKEMRTLIETHPWDDEPLIQEDVLPALEC
jgi:nifR3 family TIM-barrel protein